MNDAEKLAYDALLEALRLSETSAKGYHLDKLEKFVGVVNIRIHKAIPEGWDEAGLRLAKREPLSDEEIYEIFEKYEWKGFVALIRIIEKAHGITGVDDDR